MGITLTRQGGWAGLADCVEERALTAPDVQPTWAFTGTTAPLNVTTSNALRVSDAWACIRLLADSVSSLPLKAYRRLPEGRVPAGENARITQLLQRPSPGSTSVDLISQIMVHLNLYGEVFIGLYRADGEIVQLGLIHPESVTVELVERAQVVYTGEFATLDRDGVLALSAAAADRTDAALYVTAAFTGLRQGELLALRWRDVDLVADRVHVRRNFTDRTEKVPKGKRVRSVPMVPDVADALATLKDREHFTDDDDLVFCSPFGGFLDSWALRRRFYRALDAAGLPRVRFHDLRHCFGTHGIRAWDPTTLQAYMGHQHYSTTARYLHHRPAADDAARLAAAFGFQGYRERVA